jgi:hypothetical protein
MQYGISNTTQLILANQCPFADGPAVFKARALYDFINFSNEVYYDEDCPEKGYSGRAASNDTENNSLNELLAITETKKITKKIKTEYFLYPNPAFDKIYIRSKSNNEQLDIYVCDILGRVFLTTNLSVKNHLSTINFDIPNGVYFLTVIDSKKQKSAFKLIINK